MGINGLWKTVETSEESVSLQRYASIETDKLRKGGDNRLIRLGVDLSPLMSECVAAASAPSLHGRFVGGELYILFNKLMAYLHIPAIFIFVLDGKRRPTVKRNTSVIDRDAHWKKRATRIIEYCGYYTHEAPGEAEAELAALNANGYIDAVITSDSDVFAFGALSVLRSLPKAVRAFDDEHKLFLADAIHRDARLTRGGFILFALLAGGDYGAGLEGVGSSTALILAQAGFGDALLNAIEALSGTDLQVFLDGWRHDIRLELTENPLGRFKKRPPARIAELIDNTFPNLATLDMYRLPLTSWSEESPPDVRRWLHTEPNIGSIAEFCAQNFDWDTGKLLSTNLGSRLWAPMCLQLLYSKYLLYDSESKILKTPTSDCSIEDYTLVMRKGKYALAMDDEPQARLVVSTMTFVQLLAAKFPIAMNDAVKRVTVYAPKLLLPPTLKTTDFRRVKTPTSKAKGKRTLEATKTRGSGTSIRKTETANKKQKIQPRNATPGPSNSAGQSNSNLLDDYADDLLWTLNDDNISIGEPLDMSSGDDDLPEVGELFNRHLRTNSNNASSSQLSAPHHNNEVIDLTGSDDEEKPEAGETKGVPHRFLGVIELTDSEEDL